jgi:hypothetical protein
LDSWRLGLDALHRHDLRSEAAGRFFEGTDLALLEIKAISRMY